MLLTQFVELRVHGVQHGHHLHRRDAAADGGEADDVAEEDGHALEHLHTLLPYFNFIFCFERIKDIVAQTTLYSRVVCFVGDESLFYFLV